MPAPTSQQFNHMFKAYAVCTLFLFVKYLVTAVYAVNQDNHPEEDSILGDRKNPEDIKRRSRVFGNDLENIPFHTAIFWAAFVVQCFANLSDYGKTETVALTVLIVLYTALRFGYTLCYVFKVQPLRSICFILANLCVGIAACVMVSSAFNVETDYFVA